MSAKRWVVVVAVAVVVVAVVFWSRRRQAAPPVAVRLVDQFATIEKRSNLPLEKAFALVDVTIRGETKRCVFACPTSRIVWKVTPPPDSWLSTSLALKPEVWDKPGDGVLFRIGISDGRTYEELLNRHVDPANVQADRGWIPVSIDLSAYGGRSVDLIFNTNSSLPGKGDDTRNDDAVWASPEIRRGR